MNGQVFAIHIPTALLNAGAMPDSVGDFAVDSDAGRQLIHATRPAEGTGSRQSFLWAFRTKKTGWPTARRSAAGLAGALLATTMLAGFATPAHAQSVVWNGSVSSDWDDPANWNANPPGPLDTVVINNNTATSNVSTESGVYSIKSLIMGTVLGSDSHLYVNGTLFFSGIGSPTPDYVGRNGGKARVDVRGSWSTNGVILGSGTGDGSLIVSGRRGEVVRIDLSRIERLQAESEYVRLFTRCAVATILRIGFQQEKMAWLRHQPRCSK